ncbi:MAG: hypothetical protein ABI600_01925 [Luteolibacter sp.]
MLDRIRFLADRVFLTEEAAHAARTVKGFKRTVTNEGEIGPRTMVLKFLFGKYPLVRIVAHRPIDGRWRIKLIDANLPALVWGHNGHPIRTDRELALALTRLRYIASLVTSSECQERLIPGIGKGNRGHLSYVEFTGQIQDPEQRLLRSTHVAHRRYQHKHPLVNWKKFTLFDGEESALKFYDKHAQLRGVVTPADFPCTRFELTLKKAERIGRDVSEWNASRQRPEPTGSVVTTLSVRAAYGVLLHSISELSGFGQFPDPSLVEIKGAAQSILIGLGSRIGDPHAVDEALENYVGLKKPCPKTLQDTTKAVRAYAVKWHEPDFETLLPAALEDVRWSEISLYRTEEDFKQLMREIGAPSEADSAIVTAWSKATLLKSKPDSCELVGTLFAPADQLPFRKATTL